MPRTARIDIPDILYHVIVRGIERREIFADDEDRHGFVIRLSSLLVETETVCLAWALMSNHAHFLLRPTRCKLAIFMRRLLTGHAVAFNLRHHRSGHLFQNRYKSIVCQEDEYLLQLIRYIHLNPLRVKLVKDLVELEKYRWTGHRVLMGRQDLAGQDVECILALFGNKKTEARRSYKQFIADGIAEGRRDDLVGNTLKSDDGVITSRVLGLPEFVEEILLREGNRCQNCGRRTIEEIVNEVAAAHGVAVRAISAGSRLEVAVKARSTACRLALEEGYSAAEVARHLGMSRYGVGVAGRRNYAEIAASNEKSAS